AYSDPAQQMKLEVHVDNDDLAGDEDSMLLSLHAFRDGKEVVTEWGFMSSHITVSMKLQQNIWRLNKISIGAEFPVGDPQFVEKTFLKTATGAATGLSSVSGVTGLSAAALPEAHSEVSLSFASGETTPPVMKPEQVVTMLAYAESSFARIHPEEGFTCS